MEMKTGHQLRESSNSTQDGSAFFTSAKAPVLPGILGARRRWLVLIVSVIGLATFVFPLIKADPAVFGRNEWAPLQVVTELYNGTLPARAYPVDLNSRPVDLGLDIFFGCGTVYLLLLVIIAAAVLFPRAKFICGVAAWGGAAMCVEFRYQYSDIQSAIYGFAPLDLGNQVNAPMLGSILLAVLVLLVLIASANALDY
jgi:hypothetical protein